MSPLVLLVSIGVLIAILDSTAQVTLKKFSLNNNSWFFAGAVLLYTGVAFLLYTSYKKNPDGFSAVNLFWVSTSALIISAYGIFFLHEKCQIKTAITTILVIAGVLIKVSCFIGK